MARMGNLVNGLSSIEVGADASIRVIKVMEIEDAGGDWMREAAKQMTGFGLGGVSGIGAGRVAFSGGVWAASQTGLTLAGPAGWLVLGGIFLVSVAAGYFVGGYIDKKGQVASEFLMNRF